MSAYLNIKKTPQKLINNSFLIGLARCVEITPIKFVYHVLGISELIYIRVVLGVVPIDVLLLDLILKPSAIAS